MQDLNVEKFVLTPVTNEHTLTRFNLLRRMLDLEPKSVIDDGHRSWIIANRLTGAYLGYVNIVPFDREQCELGFALIPEARQQAVMSTVLPRFVELLSTRIYTETSDTNVAAIRVLEKSGFRSCEPEHEFHTTPNGETVRTRAFRYIPPGDRSRP